MSLSSRFVVLSVHALLAAFACGCGSEGGPIPSSDVGGSGTGAASPDGGAAGDACSFVLVEGGTETAWTGTARARMNGSGNLRVVCAGPSAEDELELAFGNATFDGPRTYEADDFTSDGSVRLTNGDRFPYTSMAKGASCVLALTEAPLDARGSSVPRGARIAGSFECAKLVSSADGNPWLAIQGGALSAVVE